jgi:hypothetical protein
LILIVGFFCPLQETIFVLIHFLYFSYYVQFQNSFRLYLTNKSFRLYLTNKSFRLYLTNKSLSCCYFNQLIFWIKKISKICHYINTLWLIREMLPTIFHWYYFEWWHHIYIFLAIFEMFESVSVKIWHALWIFYIFVLYFASISFVKDISFFMNLKSWYLL